MKKIIFFLFLQSISMITLNAQVRCHQGDQTPPHRDPYEQRADSSEFLGQTSVDPNEIIGPQGYDSLQWVSINDLLNYTIYFENDPDFATANAQRVDVRFDFDKKNLMKDFVLGTYGFANMSWNIENAASTYQNRLDLVDTMQIYVDLIAGLDVTRNQAFWKFSSIDPETGFAPWQHDRGMLPINDSTHVGEGFVQFSIKPVSTMKTGDTISIAAKIVFDENDTIPTNRWKNVIDAGNPTSKVVLASHSDNDSICHLAFQAQDDENGSGVKQVRLYLANQFGVFEEVAVCHADSIYDFVTEAGRQYEFYSLAEDHVGNLEALKERPDLVINNNTAPSDLILSDSIFQDDIEIGGFIGELSTVDAGDDVDFIYALTEGNGAIHNDLFMVEGTQLKTKESFKCADDSIFFVRLSTTDQGGLSYSKAFRLRLENVLEKPESDTLDVVICEGDVYEFFDQELDEAGQYFYTKSNDYKCDSLYVLNLQVLPVPQIPEVFVQDGTTLVSSIERGNQWFKDGNAIEGATEKTFTPTETGIYYVVQTNGACYSQPSDQFYANMDRTTSFNMPLTEGWTWISSNLSDMHDPKVWLSLITDDLERFVGMTEELVADPSYGLTGNLKVLDPAEAYKIEVNKSTSLDMSGNIYLPDEVTLDLQPGWNWLGYIPASNLALEEALINLSPSENDIIKGQNQFATFTGGQWIGTLTTLEQGKGYMYCSATAQSFKYPYSFITKVVANETPLLFSAYSIPWEVNMHKYPNNMTLIGEIVVDNKTAPAGAFTIGAFCEDECRGIGQYVNDRLFLTVHGNTSDDVISFRAIENATGQEYKVEENVPFGENGLGTYTSPFKLHIGDNTTDINNTSEEDYNIYPSPVRNVLFINGDTEKIKSVKVIAVSGAVTDIQDTYIPEVGLDVSTLSDGNYLLGIVTDKGVVYKRFIKVK